MKRGLGVKDAVTDSCKRIATTSVRDPKRRRPDGKTTFNASFYAVNKEGKFFGGCIYPGGKMAVHDGDSARVVSASRCTRSEPAALQVPGCFRAGHEKTGAQPGG
ncbi:MAG: hypothetical protein ACXWO3_06415 [Isosphaeraceae bacterium]